MLGFVLFLTIVAVVVLFSILGGRIESLKSDVEMLKNSLERLREKSSAHLDFKSPAQKTPIPEPAGQTFPAPVAPPLPTPPPLVQKPVVSQADPIPAVISQPASSVPLRAPQAARTQKTEGTAPSFEFNWEQFLGVKMFAWFGGLILFISVLFALKYSVDNNLIPPALRMSIGALFGIGLVIAGAWPKKQQFAVLSQTLCAVGVVVLYAVLFASTSLYHLLPPPAAFVLMVVVTAAAFSIAVALDGQFVAILGLLGGFLTPFLLGSGEDHALGLFSYIFLLNAGLGLVVLRKNWGYMQALAVFGTVVMEIAWSIRFYSNEKIWTLFGILTVFQVGYIGLLFAQRTKNNPLNWHFGSACGHATASILFFSALLLAGENPIHPLAELTGLAVISATALLAVSVVAELYWIHSIFGMMIFGALSIWMSLYFKEPALKLILAFDLIFAVLHSAGPAILQKLRGAKIAPGWTQVFPIIAMLLVLVPIYMLDNVSPIIWGAIIAVNLVVMFFTVIMATYWALAVMIVLTLVAVGSWIARVPVAGTDIDAMLWMVGGFAVALFTGSVLVLLHYRRSLTLADATKRIPLHVVQLPALSAALPYVLLIMVMDHLHLANPSFVYGLALLLSVMLLGTARWAKTYWLGWVALGGTVLTQWAWHSTSNQGMLDVALAWSVLFFVLFFGYALVFKKSFTEQLHPWAIACIGGLAHFLLVHRNILEFHPNHLMGLVPLVFALPYLGSTGYLLRGIPEGSPRRNAILAWYGGTALFFITIIFPVQFGNEWLTIAWALEGAALIWLRNRIRHNGLWMVGCGLLAVAFARLALNPAILEYHVRSSVPVLNWYLYTYGLAIAAMLCGSCLLKRQELGKWDGWNCQGLLTGAALVLLFLLMNIEIADYFATGATLTFDFSGNFARDMAYSIGWAIFALGLLVAGIRHQAKAARYASIGLFGITVLKIFFHDISQLSALYRIATLVVVAVLLILSSFLYQKFVAKSPESK